MTVADIRAQFPALERCVGSVPVAYFDGPGGTQSPRSVGEAMLDYFYHHNANTHWNYPSSAETDAMLLASRRALADFVNGVPEEIAFGANMTTLTFHLARALGRGWKAGDIVVTTELDHHANVAPWRALERERGIVIRSVRMHPDLYLSVMLETASPRCLLPWSAWPRSTRTQLARQRVHLSPIRPR